MLGVRRVGCDLGIAQCRGQAFGGDRRIIVQVDQVVSDARMLRLALHDRPEYGRAFHLIGVSLVRWRGRNVERDRIENLRLVVGRVTAGKRFHRFQVGLNPRLMRDLVVIDVHHR